MKLYPALFILFSVPLVSTAEAAEATLDFFVSGKLTHFTLSEMKNTVPPIIVTVFDPVHKKTMTYDALPLAPILKMAGIEETSGDEVIFEAKDGYAPSASITLLISKKGYLAFSEHNAKNPWSKIESGKAWITAAPFYLIWDEPKKKGETLPWPYQLVKIEAIRFNEKFAKMYPASAAKDSPEMRGFITFKSQCMRCHSINLQGGEVGPELNIPKNVTEYWEKNHLPAFIRNPSSYRAKSRMPAFGEFSDAEIADVIKYLEWMKSRKAE